MKLTTETGRTFDLPREAIDMLASAATARDADFICEQFDIPKRHRGEIWIACGER